MTEKAERIGLLLALYQFSVGSLRFVIDKMLPILETLGNAAAVEQAKKAREAIKRARSARYDWEQQKKMDSLARAGTKELDDEIDQTLSAMFQTLEGFAKLAGADEKGDLAAEMVDALFPAGVFPITSQAFDDQYAAITEMLERCRGPFAEHIDKLGVDAYVDKLEELNAEFGQKLKARTVDVDYDEVEATFAEAQNQFHGLVARVMADYFDDMETFNRVMEPVWEQTERTRRSYQKTGSPPEVDPETGEPVDPGEEPPPPADDAPMDGGENQQEPPADNQPEQNDQ